MRLRHGNVASALSSGRRRRDLVFASFAAFNQPPTNEPTQAGCNLDSVQRFDLLLFAECAIDYLAVRTAMFQEETEESRLARCQRKPALQNVIHTADTELVPGRTAGNEG